MQEKLGIYFRANGNLKRAMVLKCRYHIELAIVLATCLLLNALTVKENNFCMFFKKCIYFSLSLSRFVQIVCLCFCREIMR